MSLSFSIQPWENVGFTDQLLQFDCFYKLGRSMGWTYRHRDFHNHRSSPGIYDFLGFNDYMRAVSGSVDWPRKRKMIALSLGDDELDAHGIGTLGELQQYVKQTADRLIRSHEKTSPPHLQLSLQKRSSRKFFSVIQRNIRDLPDQLDLHRAFTDYGRHHSTDSPSLEGRFKILVHIRLGDTAFLKTPWNSFIFLGRDESGRAGLVQAPRVEPDKYIEPPVYLRVVNQIVSMFSPEYPSTMICSDGYRRLISTAMKRQTRLGLTTDQMKQLGNLGASYDRDRFDGFKSVPGTELLIGETDENLRSLIDSALGADLIVIGRVQRMIPKLLTLYPKPDAPRKVLVIGAGPGRISYERLGLGDGRKARFVGVPIDEKILDSNVRHAVDELIPKGERNRAER